MSKAVEKVSYLKGLLDGLDPKDESCAKLFRAVIDALEEIAETVSEHDDLLDDLSDTVDEMIDEIDYHDAVLFDDEDEDDDYEEDEEDDGFFEIICPSCGEKIYFDEDMLDSDDGLICPNCNEFIDIDIADPIDTD